MSRRKKPTDEEIVGAKYELLRCFPPGSTVYFIVRSVARSGMSRVMTPIAVFGSHDEYGPPFWYIGHYVAKLLGCQYVDDGHNSIRATIPRMAGSHVHGCGMDMGLHVADRLSLALYGSTGHLKSSLL